MNAQVQLGSFGNMLLDQATGVLNHMFEVKASNGASPTPHDMCDALLIGIAKDELPAHAKVMAAAILKATLRAALEGVSKETYMEKVTVALRSQISDFESDSPLGRALSKI